MTAAQEVLPEDVFKIHRRSAELSPFHQCYATENTILRIAAGRYYVHNNGDGPVTAYWRLRQKAVIYDVPERPVEISGPDIVPFLEYIFARNVSGLKAGRGVYAIACTFQGGIFMDGILFKLERDRYWYVQPDGALETWLLAHSNGFDITVSDPHSRVLQIQGPNSLRMMQDASEGMIDETLGYFRSGFFKIGGQQVYISRTGWTGELGFEIYTQGDDTDCPRLWDHLMTAGATHGMIFSGLQSMNIRRIEAGILDNGSDFDSSMTPFDAGLSKFIDMEKPDFIGREALLEAKPGKRLFGLICHQATPSSGFKIFDGDNQVGFVTTGAYSPYLKAGIGYVRFSYPEEWAGRNLSMRCASDKSVICEIIDPPFYDYEKAIPRGRKVEVWE